jgi:hypothetical protein
MTILVIQAARINLETKSMGQSEGHITYLGCKSRTYGNVKQEMFLVN